MSKPHFSRYFIAGLTALIPLWVTWLVFRFMYGILSEIGDPLIASFARLIEPFLPAASGLLRTTFAQGFLEVIVVLVLMYLVGLATTAMLGKRIIQTVEDLLDKIPLVKSIYGAVKRLVTVLTEKPDGADVQRVVLIEFPNKNMKTVGLVTRTFNDSTTGRRLLSVFVPTTPNPTSGYLEIVPADSVVSTDWTLDQAMSFVISGGTIAPDNVSFDHPPRSCAESASKLQHRREQASHLNGDSLR